MPRIKTTQKTVYSFSELTEKAQDKAIDNLYELNIEMEWWNYTYEDAERAGFKITEFDIDRGNMIRGELAMSVLDSIKAVMEDHGKESDTYKTAESFLARAELLEAQEDDDNCGTYDANDYTMDDLTEEYTRAMLEEYLSILRKEYEYQASREQIIETIEANNYEFDENGKLA